MKTTLYKKKNVKRKRKHGFLSRSRKRNGKKVLRRRRRRARHSLSV